jgi:hypothetical protein
VIRFHRGRYRPGDMPQATEHRIFTRVRALHDEVANSADPVPRA